jgi:hypothetical protein
MKNDSLLQNLKTIQYSEEKIDSFKQAGIDTYSRLLSLLGNNTTDTTLRIDLCDALWQLRHYLDKRRVVRPLVVALNAKEVKLRSAAARAIGMIGLKRAIPHLIKAASDKSQSYLPRFVAIWALGTLGDVRALMVLRTIVADKTENLGLRGHALEQTQCFIDKSSVQYYITLLADTSIDLRFWAAYCLSQIHYQADISPALAALDDVVSFDHTVPMYWGWHVDREALLPFETIYLHSLNPDAAATPYFTWLISPAAEYDSFIRQYRRWTETWVYTTEIPPKIDLHIDKSWLIHHLQERWVTIALNVRQPTPKAYSVNFQLTLSGQMLLGGLHRDGYTLVLTGVQEAIFEFATWYRSLFASDQSLFLYEWADVGITLTENISAQEIRQLVALRDESRKSP